MRIEQSQNNKFHKPPTPKDDRCRNQSQNAVISRGNNNSSLAKPQTSPLSSAISANALDLPRKRNPKKKSQNQYTPSKQGKPLLTIEALLQSQNDVVLQPRSQNSNFNASDKCSAFKGKHPYKYTPA